MRADEVGLFEKEQGRGSECSLALLTEVSLFDYYAVALEQLRHRIIQVGCRLREMRLRENNLANANEPHRRCRCCRLSGISRDFRWNSTG